MRLSAWFSALWEFLKDLDADYDPIEQLEARISALERTMTTASMAISPDNPAPPDNPVPSGVSSGPASPTGRI